MATRLSGAAHSLLRSMVRNPQGVKVLNSLYSPLPPRLKYRIWARTAKDFRNAKPPRKPAAWHLNAGNYHFVLPLSPDRMWLDWDHAVSVLGHDPEVKEYYFDCLNRRSIDTFFDIGANYGTHSLIFLVGGVRTFSFEPNPQCRDVFREICRMNDVTPQLYEVALGEAPGTATLAFSTHETWNGTLVQGKSAAGSNSVTVSVRTLDEFSAEASGRILVKIDVEGFEIHVLHGGNNFIERHNPHIIFESNQGDPSRNDIFEFFAEKGYDLKYLPPPGSALSKADFNSALQTNFLAVPRSAAPTRP